jgi:hypothetical protein
MQISGIPFGTTDWALIEKTDHKGHVSLEVPCITCRTFHRFTVARQSEMRSLTTSGIAEGDISSIRS